MGTETSNIGRDMHLAMSGEAEQQYFHVIPSKLILMSICTLGIYPMYWNYKNWKYIKLRDQSSTWPFWRCIFYPIWFYPLLSDINRHARSNTLDSAAYRVMLTVALFILSASWRQPDPIWLLSFLTFLPMLPALDVIHSINSPAGRIGHRAVSHRPVNFLAYLLIGPLALYVIASAIGIVPGTTVVKGDQLWARDVSQLREAGVLGPEEVIIYFYSAGIFSVEEDGQFISDKFVTSYAQNAEDGEIYMAYAAYEDIENISVYWGEYWVDDTVVTISPFEEEPFEIWLSQESGGDRLFVSELNRLWRESGGRGLALPPGR